MTSLPQALRVSGPLSDVDVLVVDAERAFAEGLALCLGADTAAPVRSAGGAVEALHLTGQQPPDVVVLGAEPGTWQPAFLRALRRRHPGVAVLVLSAAAGDEDLRELVKAGARGWLPKSAPLAELSRVVEQVAAGQWWLPRELMGQVVQELDQQAEAAVAERLDALTYRERQVLAAMAEGLSRAEIARRLRLSVNTVRTHVQHLLAKLEVHTSLEAVALALREGVGIAGPPHPAGRDR